MQPKVHDRPPSTSRKPRKQRACSECQRRKQRCIFKNDGSPCTNCMKRFPPVECNIRLVDGEDIGERIITLPTSRPRFSRVVRESAVPDGDYLPPIANAEWLRVDTGTFQYQDSTYELRRANLARSGTNLILDGRGDASTLRPFGGILTEVNSVGSLPLHNTARNVELLHFYLRFVVPNLVSIDGESQPQVFLSNVLPWQLQSPVFPNVGLLMASVTQSLDQGIELDQNPETFAMKARALSCVNQYLDMTRNLKRHFSDVMAEAIKVVVNLVVMEWFWGSDESMRAHIRGIKEMIRLTGGLKAFQDPVILGIVVLTDYEISCGFETDVCWQDDGPYLADRIPVPTSWTKGFDSPLIPSEASFEDNAVELGLNAVAAKILDDVRFLVTSITDPPSEKNTTLKIRSTASWILNKLEALPQASNGATAGEDDLIQDTIRLAALVHCRSIAHLTLISKLPQPSISHLNELYTTMRTVSLTRWKKTPGIFLWIMLVLCPSAASDRRGRFIRRKMAVAGLSIGFEQFPLGISYLRAFWLVQRWIVGQQSY
ncbi:hypothetical protein GE09DRAFT_501927 [Coniochaeta sp. 2T2.1]|nr:hypothetical protein GE09DRAFT_501927 [Coniochaeta sp. 2T2.1]